MSSIIGNSAIATIDGQQFRVQHCELTEMPQYDNVRSADMSIFQDRIYRGQETRLRIDVGIHEMSNESLRRVHVGPVDIRLRFIDGSARYFPRCLLADMQAILEVEGRYAMIFDVLPAAQPAPPQPRVLPQPQLLIAGQAWPVLRHHISREQLKTNRGTVHTEKLNCSLGFVDDGDPWRNRTCSALLKMDPASWDRQVLFPYLEMSNFEIDHDGRVFEIVYDAIAATVTFPALSEGMVDGRPSGISNEAWQMAQSLEKGVSDSLAARQLAEREGAAANLLGAVMAVADLGAEQERETLGTLRVAHHIEPSKPKPHTVPPRESGRRIIIPKKEPKT